MALVLQLLLLSGAQGDPVASVEGHSGELVNISCVGISNPIRWAWAPSFPACKGLSKGRRRILSASLSSGPTAPAAQPFAGRLRTLGPGIGRLQLLLSAGDSGTFYCKGGGKESGTAVRVLEDRADCRPPEGCWSSPGGCTGAPCGTNLDHSPDLLCPPHKVRAQLPPRPRPVMEEPKPPAQEDGEQSLLYANLDQMALRNPRRLTLEVPADASTTVYTVVI
ncbi:megakaryocyte and platelet inhibitory receptor G6b [Echinops telfairi]|uniref:Megakaryocyte and platelet inhibitory receptor G6b n=1 Tax=Echinops telfairi TaxID=9371 RepID=A0AC55D8X4_ECHTE|nr:megakaryocyte and platelet inhibitory receptor G6b [Echinops telfairi]